MNKLLRHTMAPAALLALALPVLSGCHASVRGVEEPDGTERPTVLSLRVTAGLPGEGVRAVTESQDPNVAPADGTGEGKITYMQVSMPQVGLLRQTALTPGAGGTEYTARFELPLKQSVTTPYAVLVGSQDLGLTQTNFTADQTVGSDHFLDVIHEDGFIQTSKSSDGSATIEPGVTDPSPTNGNFISSEVERVVAKVQVSQKDGLSLTLPNIGTLSSLTYSMAGSAKETYLFRDHAGTRTLVDETTESAIYEGFKSVIDDKTVPTDWDPKAGHPFLRRVSDKEGADYVLGGYYRNPKAVTNATATVESIKGGFYFYENSMYGGTKKVADKKGEIKYNRIAYAKVYTKLTPTKAYTEKGGKKEVASSDDFTKPQSYNVEISKELYDKLKADPAYRDRVDNWIGFQDGVARNIYVLKVTDKAGTFYEGVDDGLLYLRLRDALMLGKNTAVRKYDEGRMVYLIPLNRQLDPTKGFVNYCDTRRNNIYDLTITGISGIGKNHDPVDPEDPNVPKPEDNPFEPPTDPQIPVEEADYLMRITAKVIKWNLVEKHYALWN
ncbi:Mfa1 family fimbria major subunit [uncultured Porphyromonas sp.]|uniref:Mfa1 family fimbria major subunit n=1 Tax=uncultured Porphyromonas sp. TaxID=159274 RepID=UPI002623D79E|nr:Mfa1 family fimbria major subunit [uncultured Porphyromonas sp.]